MKKNKKLMLFIATCTMACSIFSACNFFPQTPDNNEPSNPQGGQEQEGTLPSEEKLIIAVVAESGAEVGEVYKPVVTLLDGANYTFTVTGAPEGVEIPTVTDNRFTPTALGTYTFKIVASKSGAENEEYEGTVEVVDLKKPTVLGVPTTAVKADKGVAVNFDSLISGVSVTDNFDGEIFASNIKAKKVYSAETLLATISNETEFTFTESGEYEVIYAVEDTSGNAVEFTIPVIVEGIWVSLNVKTEYFEYDTLVVPEYKVISAEQNPTIQVTLDGVEVENGSLLSTAGEKKLAITFGEYSAEVQINVSEIAVQPTLADKIVGDTLTCANAVSYVNDASATVESVEITLVGDATTKITGDEVYEIPEIGFYTMKVTLKKGEYNPTFTTDEIYVTTPTEVYSFEPITSTNQRTGADFVAKSFLAINTDPTYVKYGKQSAKVTLTPGSQSVNITNPGNIDTIGIVNAGINTVSVWLYASEEVTFQFGLAMGKQEGKTSNAEWFRLHPIEDSWAKITLQAGWQNVVLPLNSTVPASHLNELFFWNASKSTDIYVDSLSLYSDVHVMSTLNKLETAVDLTTDLSELYFTLGFTGTPTVTMTAERGSFDGYVYTAPTTAGEDVITITVTDGLKEKSCTIPVLVNSYSLRENELYSFESDTNGAGFTVSGKGGTAVVSEEQAKYGKSSLKVVATTNNWTHVNFETQHVVGDTWEVKLDIYAVTAGTWRIGFTQNYTTIQDSWWLIDSTNTLVDHNTFTLQAGVWTEVTVKLFRMPCAPIYSMEVACLEGAGTAYIDHVRFMPYTYQAQENEVVSFETLTTGANVTRRINKNNPYLSLINTDANYVKYGKASMKLTTSNSATWGSSNVYYSDCVLCPANKVAGVTLIDGCNTVGAWIYSSQDCKISLMLMANDYDPYWVMTPNEGTQTMDITAGWNYVEFEMNETINDSNAYIAGIRLESNVNATFYLDCITTFLK